MYYIHSLKLAFSLTIVFSLYDAFLFIRRPLYSMHQMVFKCELALEESIVLNGTYALLINLSCNHQFAQLLLYYLPLEEVHFTQFNFDKVNFA